jgi:thiamine kinase-like enzyme
MNSVSDINTFYYEKTNQRMRMFLNDNSQSYYEQPYLINGKRRPSMSELFNEIDFNKFKNNPFYSLFHGDLQFDNVILNSSTNEFFYIDWRDSFGENTEGGDIYYDLSKLYGGLMIPYNIMKVEDSITYSEGIHTINYSYPISNELRKFKLYYEKWLVDNGFDLEKIKLITGLIYLNMSPLHDGNFGKMLWFKSIEILDEYDK